MKEKGFLNLRYLDNLDIEYEFPKNLVIGDKLMIFNSLN